MQRGQRPRTRPGWDSCAPVSANKPSAFRRQCWPIHRCAANEQIPLLSITTCNSNQFLFFRSWKRPLPRPDSLSDRNGIIATANIVDSNNLIETLTHFILYSKSYIHVFSIIYYLLYSKSCIIIMYMSSE